MLTLFENNELNKVASSYMDQVRNALKNKQLERQAVRYDWLTRQYIYQGFKSAVNASGRLYDSVQSVDVDNGLQVICDSYIDNLIFGQAPGENVSVDDIMRWMNDKNLDPTERAAKNIARKINKFGNSIFVEHQGQNSGLLDDVNIDAETTQMEEVLASRFAQNISTIIDDLKIAA